jgi:hypothetical protein
MSALSWKACRGVAWCLAWRVDSPELHVVGDDLIGVEGLRLDALVRVEQLVEVAVRLPRGLRKDKTCLFSTATPSLMSWLGGRDSVTCLVRTAPHPPCSPRHAIVPTHQEHGHDEEVLGLILVHHVHLQRVVQPAMDRGHIIILSPSGPFLAEEHPSLSLTR